MRGLCGRCLATYTERGYGYVITCAGKAALKTTSSGARKVSNAQ